MTNLIAAFCNFVNVPKKHVMDIRIHFRISGVGVFDITIAYQHLNSC